MKILHTSDWHLGQKLLGRDREEEHRLALDWLAAFISENQVDVLIVAGDVFDIHNPPNSSRELYFRFLKKLIQSNCQHVVIVGGNHDSPNMLEAPKEILQLLGIHVVGAATGDISDEIIELKNEDGALQLVVAAVPFLRDQDLRKAFAGESTSDRYGRVREAIKSHYQQIGEVLNAKKPEKVPIVATGHLHATGAQSSEKQDNIYLGNLENISANDFPELFDYVALGHIHRPQAVGNHEKVRYSGSILPLSFSETKDEKVVVLLEPEENGVIRIQEQKIPVFRRLKTIEGSVEYIKERLGKLGEDYKSGLQPWVELIVDEENPSPHIADELRDFASGLHAEVLAIRLKRTNYSSLDELVNVQLDALSAEEVFLRRCEAADFSEEDKTALLTTFKELLEWMQQNEDPSKSGS